MRKPISQMRKLKPRQGGKRAKSHSHKSHIGIHILAWGAQHRCISSPLPPGQADGCEFHTDRPPRTDTAMLPAFPVSARIIANQTSYLRLSSVLASLPNILHEFKARPKDQPFALFPSVPPVQELEAPPRLPGL